MMTDDATTDIRVLHIQDAWEIPGYMSHLAAIVAEGYTFIYEVPNPCNDMAWLFSKEEMTTPVQEAYNKWLDEEE